MGWIKRGLKNGLIFLLLYFHSGHVVAGDAALYPILGEYVRDFKDAFRKIPEERRYRLDEITRYLAECRDNGIVGQLLFIDTDQSALSLWCEIWAKTAAFYFDQLSVQVFSGAIQPGPIALESIFSLERAGFIVYRSGIEGAEVYKVKYTYNLEPVMAFSKRIDFRKNPRKDFMAIIVEPNADLNLARVKGTFDRLAILHDDPTGYQESPQKEEIFDGVCRKIAIEMFYVFWRLKHEE